MGPPRRGPFHASGGTRQMRATLSPPAVTNALLSDPHEIDRTSPAWTLWYLP